mmetsp:Transcript_25671/g.81518  ORF Transcript_25671/g.81518 Transcript_25671/m.81518 type:complete len:261 (-) Transcript_25671:1402-2184(-)
MRDAVGQGAPLRGGHIHTSIGVHGQHERPLVQHGPTEKGAPLHHHGRHLDPIEHGERGAPEGDTNARPPLLPIPNLGPPVDPLLDPLGEALASHHHQGRPDVLRVLLEPLGFAHGPLLPPLAQGDDVTHDLQQVAVVEVALEGAQELGGLRNVMHLLHARHQVQPVQPRCEEGRDDVEGLARGDVVEGEQHDRLPRLDALGADHGGRLPRAIARGQLVEGSVHVHPTDDFHDVGQLLLAAEGEQRRLPHERHAIGVRLQR